jgi:hypothetical protein
LTGPVSEKSNVLNQLFKSLQGYTRRREVVKEREGQALINKIKFALANGNFQMNSYHLKINSSKQ